MYLIKKIQQHIKSKQHNSICLNCTDQIKKGELNSNFTSKLIVSSLALLIATKEFQKEL